MQISGIHCEQTSIDQADQFIRQEVRYDSMESIPMGIYADVG